MSTKETKKNIIQAGRVAIKELIKVAKEPIIDFGPDISADRLKNAAATKKLAIFDALEILNRIEEEQNMLDDKPKFTFNYFGGFRKDNTKDDNDNKLVREPIFQKDQNISNTLKNGVYRSRNIFFDPRTFCYEEINYYISKDGVSTTL